MPESSGRTPVKTPREFAEQPVGIHQENHNHFACAGEDDMDKRCSKCGGELMEGVLMDEVTFHSLVYTPMEELTKR